MKCIYIMELKFYELSDLSLRIVSLIHMIKYKRNVNECCYKINCNKHLQSTYINCAHCYNINSSIYCCFCNEIFRLENALETISNINLPREIKVIDVEKNKSILNCNPQRLNVKCLNIQIESVIGILRRYRNENRKCCYKVICPKHTTNTNLHGRCERCCQIIKESKYCCFCTEMYNFEKIQSQISIIDTK